MNQRADSFRTKQRLITLRRALIHFSARLNALTALRATHLTRAHNFQAALFNLSTRINEPENAIFDNVNALYHH